MRKLLAILTALLLLTACDHVAHEGEFVFTEGEGGLVVGLVVDVGVEVQIQGFGVENAHVFLFNTRDSLMHHQQYTDTEQIALEVNIVEEGNYKVVAVVNLPDSLIQTATRADDQTDTRADDTRGYVEPLTDMQITYDEFVEWLDGVTDEYTDILTGEGSAYVHMGEVERISIYISLTGKTKHYPVLVGLMHDTDLPLYEVVESGSSSVKTRAAVDSIAYASLAPDQSGYDLRHVMQIYEADARGEFTREVLSREVYTYDNITELDHDLEVDLPAGTYRFIVWTDYVDDGSTEDKYYDTSDFAEVKLLGDHVGSTDRRDAFWGSGELTVTADGDNYVELDMARPMAKYTFISNDLDAFVANVKASLTNGQKQTQELASTAPDAVQTVNMSDYDIVFNYSGFMPCSYNLYTGKPADSSTGAKFSSTAVKLDDTEAQLGFDYVFMNGSQTTVSLVIQVFDKSDGTLLSTSDAVSVPLLRSKHTIIYGKYLTSQGTGNVGIDAEFEGEYNLLIY